MRIVVGCPVYNRGWILEEWFEAVNKWNFNHELAFLFAYTPSNDATWEIIQLNQGRIVEVTEGKHGTDRNWNDRERIETLATTRNILLDWAADYEADYFFSLDSDIILTSNWNMLIEDHPHAVVSPQVRLAPDVSITNGFTRRKDGWYNRVARDHEGKVDVVCAAKLMPMEVVRDRRVRYSFHPRGEDFAWSESAVRAGYRLEMCAGVGTVHAMSPRDRYANFP